MRVCLLHSSIEFGGVELHMIKLARFLLERGHEVTLVCLGSSVFDDWSERLDGVDVLYRPQPLRGNNMSLKDASRLMATLPGDVCIREKGSFMSGSLGLDLAARRRFRRYVTVEQLEAEPMPPKTSRKWLGGLLPGIGLWWYRRKFAGCLRCVVPHKVVCVSEAVRDRLRTEYHFPKRKMVTASNGIDAQHFRSRSDLHEQIRRELGIGPGTLVFGSIGRFQPVKRLEVAIQLFARLRKQHPQADVALLLVGQGQQERELRELAAQLELGDACQFWPFSPHPVEPLNAIDVFLMPSANEGLPFTLLEAMACERYTIATDVGGIREVLTPDCGTMVPAFDDEAFYKAMLEVLQMNSHERMRVGAAARERVEDRFNINHQLETIANLVECGAASMAAPEVMKVSAAPGK